MFIFCISEHIPIFNGWHSRKVDMFEDIKTEDFNDLEDIKVKDLISTDISDDNNNVLTTIKDEDMSWSESGRHGSIKVDKYE